MFCQKCNQRKAKIHFMQNINGSKSDLYLCEVCAKNSSGANIIPSMDINDFLTGMIGVLNKSSLGNGYVLTETRCDQCGITFDDFQNTGRLGCRHCYEAFKDRLSPVIRKLHGDTEYQGIPPKSQAQTSKIGSEIDKLRASLKEAIQKEEYELAAELRDEIKMLEENGKDDL